MKQLILSTLKDGQYKLGLNGDLLFTCGNLEVVFNKKSALEITYTLIDSLNLLDTYAEDLLDRIEEKINKEF